MDDISKKVKVTPKDKVTLKTSGPAKVTVENKSDKFLTYKLKTTRPLNAKPDHAHGNVKPKEKVTFEVKYNPFAESKPLLPTDRITILFGVLPNSAMKAREYWKLSNPAVALRYVLKLLVEEDEEDDDEDEMEEDEESDEEEPEKPEYTDHPPQSEDTGSSEED